MKRIAKYLILMIIISGCSANGDKQESEEEIVKVEANETPAQVDTLYLTPTVFAANIVSNGKIRAEEFADLSFRNADIVEEVFVHNGQRVTKGQKLAQADTYKQRKNLEQQEADISQAKLDLQDVIIGQGYDPEKMESVPAEIMKLARTRSGLDKAEAARQSTLREIEESTLRAPFDGIVANVKVQRHSMAPSSEPAMRVINDRTMSIEFPVLDREIGLIKIGDEVEVTPFSDSQSFSGRISEINPVVDENGQILVRAALSGNQGLIDGLNARVKINRNMERCLVIPKKAVVLRTGRQVVFTLENGKAMWNYVTTGAENFDSYVVEEGLKAGQTVIVSGNENLAHEAPVEVTNK